MTEGIKNILSLGLQDVINLIHIAPQNKSDSSEINNIAKELRRDGIVRIKNFISKDFADKLRNGVEEIAEQNPVSVELDNGTKFNYRSQDDPDGPDAGMLDIFNVENLIPEVNDIDLKKIVHILERTTGQEIIQLRAHAYLNRGIKNTRSYHVDNAQPVVYKAFVYLSEVPDISYGPYSFVKKSQRFSLYPYLNFFRNLFSKKYRSTDMPIYNKGRVMHAVGEKGELCGKIKANLHA